MLCKVPVRKDRSQKLTERQRKNDVITFCVVMNLVPCILRVELIFVAESDQWPGW